MSILSQDVKIDFYYKINKSVAAGRRIVGTGRDGRSMIVISSPICRTEFRCWRNEMWKMRIQMDLIVRTIRVICSVKVKRKENGGEVFSSLIAWSFWEWSSGVVQDVAAILRQSNTISICQYIAILQRYSSVILDPRTGNLRPSGAGHP